MDAQVELTKEVIAEAGEILESLEHENRLRMIDFALENDDVTLFNELTEGLQEI